MNITVKDLIEKLKKLEQDSFIFFGNNDTVEGFSFEDERDLETFVDIKVRIPVYSVNDEVPSKVYILTTE